MSGLVRLKKFKTIPFLNVAKSAESTWARIGKSTVFDLVLNAQTDTNDFIQDEMPEDDVKYYSPKLAQELQANKGDPAFDYLYDMFFNLPTGEDVKMDLLIVFDGNIGDESSPKFKAWKTRSTLILDHFDSVAEKIYFSFTIGAIDRGTATVTAGVPAYTSDNV